MFVSSPRDSVADERVYSDAAFRALEMLSEQMLSSEKRKSFFASDGPVTESNDEEEGLFCERAS